MRRSLGQDRADGDVFCMTTDGLTDQIGGEKRRAFGKRRFCEAVVESAGRPMAEQRQRVFDALLAYQGDQPRRDDVSVLGFRP